MTNAVRSARAASLVVFCAFIALYSRESSAQAAPVVDNQMMLPELEQYERFAQTLLSAPAAAWTIRGFTDEQRSRLAALPAVHPWSARLQPRSPNAPVFALLPLRAELVFNSTFPYGENDGAVWAGKGLTTVLQAGFMSHWHNVSLRVAPIFSRAENSDFPLMSNGLSGKSVFADGEYPAFIDRPQRFGEGAYQIIDPGQSSLTVEGRGLAGGISTANQQWGPADRYQFVLGDNAAGFPHIFIGSSRPLDAGVAHFDARFIWGALSQSAFSPVGGSQYFVDGENPGRRRFASGMVATVLPKGIPGMELGIARFFHSAWPEEGLRAGDFTALFQKVFKKNLPKEAPLAGSDNTQGVRDNQLFSVFTRWAPPGSGFEAYGEFGRDDHSFDFRDFIQEPDHGGSSRLLGVRKMWLNGFAIRAEGINYEAPQLTRLRPEGAVYLHSVLRQGHTQKGQPLGANAGVGSGAAAFVAADKYTSAGRTTFAWSRTVAHSTGLFYRGGPELKNAPDVYHTLSGETLRFRGPMDLSAKVNLTLDFNRYFQSDVFNLNLSIGTAYRF
ncbi:MAG: hypothetical protein H0W69_07950 [Gemmatimonadaceae bacterium]|nr:hypothetical protein [Gemmatimonadaceae bacterium]